MFILLKRVQMQCTLPVDNPCEKYMMSRAKVCLKIASHELSGPRSAVDYLTVVAGTFWSELQQPGRKQQEASDGHLTPLVRRQEGDNRQGSIKVAPKKLDGHARKNCTECGTAPLHAVGTCCGAARMFVQVPM